MYHILETSKILSAIGSIRRPKALLDADLALMTRWLWAALIACAALSLRIPVGVLGGEMVFLKPEDIAFVFLVCIAFIRIRQWTSTALDLPLFAFLSIAAISLLRGIMIGTVSSPGLSALYLLKIVQYFSLFYIMRGLLSGRGEARFYLAAIVTAAFFIGGYGIAEHFIPYTHDSYSYPFYYRVYERGLFSHQANHLSAYLMFVASLVFSFAIFAKAGFVKRMGYFAAFLFLCLPLFWTYSRASYGALLLSVSVISLLKGKRAFTVTVICALLFAVFFAPQSVLDRIISCRSALLNADPGSSSVAYRMQQARYAWETIAQYPILGIGIGARERVFYENQFVQLISEAGFVGCAAFIWILCALVKTAFGLYRSAGDRMVKALAAGYLGGFLGLIIECNTLVVFLISNIMVPFWIVTAIVVWSGCRSKRSCPV